eukprot:6934445-Alexandrium_andersonii.AAC.1
MSASLVGSEMCIRDRNAPRAISWQIRLFTLLSPLRLPGGATAPPGRRNGCLLYTSDAADDM